MIQSPEMNSLVWYYIIERYRPCTHLPEKPIELKIMGAAPTYFEDGCIYELWMDGKFFTHTSKDNLFSSGLEARNLYKLDLEKRYMNLIDYLIYVKKD